MPSGIIKKKYSGPLVPTGDWIQDPLWIPNSSPRVSPLPPGVRTPNLTHSTWPEACWTHGQGERVYTSRHGMVLTFWKTKTKTISLGRQGREKKTTLPSKVQWIRLPNRSAWGWKSMVYLQYWKENHQSHFCVHSKSLSRMKAKNQDTVRRTKPVHRQQTYIKTRRNSVFRPNRNHPKWKIRHAGERDRAVKKSQHVVNLNEHGLYQTISMSYGVSDMENKIHIDSVWHRKKTQAEDSQVDSSIV